MWWDYYKFGQGKKIKTISGSKDFWTFRYIQVWTPAIEV